MIENTLYYVKSSEKADFISHVYVQYNAYLANAYLIHI